jgi:prepilin-type processing-associated H-X9-DG protein
MAILEFIEEQQLADMYTWLPASATGWATAYTYDSLDLSRTPPIRNRQVVQNRIVTLTCPSDEPQVDVGDEKRQGTSATFHNYVANYGNTNHIGWDHLVPGNPAYIKYLSSPFVGDDWNLKHQRISKFKKISDGLSKTLLASETVQGRNGDLRGFTWWGWSAGFETFAAPNASTPDYLQIKDYCKPTDPNPPCAGQTGANTMKAGARSRHPGGVNAVMCDGSVQFIVDDVDLATWRAASTTKGDEVYSGLTP